MTAADWQVIASDMYQWMTLVSGHLWPPPQSIVEDSERYYKGSIVILVLLFTSIWAIKLAFLLFFKRLIRNVRTQTTIWWCVLAVTISSYFVSVGTIQYTCLAAPLPNIIRCCPLPGPFRFVQVTVKVSGALDVITDYMSTITLDDAFSFFSNAINIR